MKCFTHYVFRGITAFMLALSLLLTSAFATGSPYVLKSGTKATPLGTITGRIYMVYNAVDFNCRTTELMATTSINSAAPMNEVNVQMSCVYNDTGTAPTTNWDQTRTAYNAREVTIYMGLYPPIEDAHRRIAIFTAHQVISTEAYVLNLSTTC